MIDHQGFWKDFKNHAETKRVLTKYNLLTTPSDFDLLVHAVAKCWMRLAVSHLKEAKEFSSLRFRRSFYSRGYYAVYNASKAIRYLVSGHVSAKGDDHQKVSDLPDDFPDVGKWGSFLRDMYKNRLVADYDGWPNSVRELNTDMEIAFENCRNFIKVSKEYARNRCGVKL
jgi:hypothetical protein